MQQGQSMSGAFQSYTLLNAVTATTTSSDVPCGNAKRATFEFTRADHSAGSSAFVVQGTVDGGTTWHTIDIFPSTGTKTRATGATLSSNTTVLYGADLEFVGVQAIRVTVTETTDGTHTAKMFLEF